MSPPDPRSFFPRDETEESAADILSSIADTDNSSILIQSDVEFTRMAKKIVHLHFSYHQ